jgi:hypothetical protein
MKATSNMTIGITQMIEVHHSILTTVGVHQDIQTVTAHQDIKTIEVHQNTLTIEVHHDTPTIEVHQDTPTIEGHQDTPTIEVHQDIKMTEAHQDIQTTAPSTGMREVLHVIRTTATQTIDAFQMIKAPAIRMSKGLVIQMTEGETTEGEMTEEETSASLDAQTKDVLAGMIEDHVTAVQKRSDALLMTNVGPRVKKTHPCVGLLQQVTAGTKRNPNPRSGEEH